MFNLIKCQNKLLYWLSFSWMILAVIHRSASDLKSEVINIDKQVMQAFNLQVISRAKEIGKRAAQISKII